jgi:His-Xaa-Ser system radical SAM maturase HxsB
MNIKSGKNLEFVVCTNLLALNPKKLDFLKSKNINISTSLDGPKVFHDSCRKLRDGQGSYDILSDRLNWVISEMGMNKDSALMTTTPFNLKNLTEVVDEYLKFGFQSIFLRMLNPFGNAERNRVGLGYSVDEFLKNYREALKYILKLNLSGIHFSESYATLLLQRILTPFATGFVDLQSPAGVGISGVIYYTNGDVFVSDEARMLWKSTGDKKFCIGNIYTSNWYEIFAGPLLRDIISKSCIEALPGCAWCVYQPYCGGDPVKNYASHGSLFPKINNSFCLKQKGMFDLLFDYLAQGNNDVEDVFWSWVTNRNISEVRV